MFGSITFKQLLRFIENVQKDHKGKKLSDIPIVVGIEKEDMSNDHPIPITGIATTNITVVNNKTKETSKQLAVVFLIDDPFETTIGEDIDGSTLKLKMM